MKAPDEVSAMMRFKALGWGSSVLRLNWPFAEHGAALAEGRLAAMFIAISVEEAGWLVGLGTFSTALEDRGAPRIALIA